MSSHKRNFLTEYSIIAAICVGTYFIRIASGQFPASLNFALLIASFIFIPFGWEVLHWVNRKLNIFLPFDKNLPLRIFVQMTIGVALALLMRWLIHLFGEPYLGYKLDNLFLVATWVLYVFATGIMNSIFIISHFINRWKDSIQMAAQLEKEKTLVQFDNLKNQINPHFLFNALSALDSLISENPKLASQFLQHLSRVYRYVLQNKDRTAVSLEVELDFIKNYIFLVETRFQKSMNIKLNVAAESLDKMIVPVTLQVLIENAIKHNIANEQKPLHIEVSTANDYLIVENDFQPRNKVETSNGQGLENLKSLYHFLSDKALTIEQDKKFKVSIPLLDVGTNGVKQ
jgi:uncharacterized membrane-anchored protein YhcB (DUF1043 family)